jgi:hypothetical protein
MPLLPCLRRHFLLLISFAFQGPADRLAKWMQRKAHFARAESSACRMCSTRHPAHSASPVAVVETTALTTRYSKLNVNWSAALTK